MVVAPAPVVGGEPATASFPALSPFWKTTSTALGATMLGAAAALGAEFASMAAHADPRVWSALTNSLSTLACAGFIALTPVLSKQAATTPVGRAVVGLALAGSAVGIGANGLVALGQASFETALPGVMAAIVGQVAWLLWANHRYAADGSAPVPITRLGKAVGWSLLGAAGLAGLGQLLPTGSVAAQVATVPAYVVGTAAWIAWPVWYLLVGRHPRSPK